MPDATGSVSVRQQREGRTSRTFNALQYEALFVSVKWPLHSERATVNVLLFR